MNKIQFANYNFEEDLGLICLDVKNEFIKSEAQIIEVAGARGNFYQGSKTKERKIETTLLMENSSEENFYIKLTELNKLFRQMIESNSLFQLNLKKQETIFYDAYIQNIGEPEFINGTFNATFVITFIIPAGTGYEETKEELITEVMEEVFIEGNTETYPIFRGIAKEDGITNIAIINKKDYISLGESLDSGITPETKRIINVYDPCDSLTSWNQLLANNPFTLQDEITTDMTTNGYSISVSPNQVYGAPINPNNFHGGGIYKQTPRTLSDYKIEALLRFSNNYPRAKGKSLTTLYNVDKKKHLEIEIKDEGNGKQAALIVKLYNEITCKSQIIYNGSTTLNEEAGETKEKILDYKISTPKPQTITNISGSIVKVNVVKAPYWNTASTATNLIKGYEKKGILLTVKEEVLVGGVSMYKLKSNTYIKKADVVLTTKKSSTSTNQAQTITTGKLTVQETNGLNEFTDFYGWISVTKTNNRYEVLVEKVDIATGLRTGKNFSNIFVDVFNEYTSNTNINYVSYQAHKKNIDEDTKGIL
jgi:hypothetical protein